jgi:hypothetical protein
LNKFSEYIVYVDESGDHSLKSIDKDYPVFVLALTIFNKKEYADNIVPNYQDFKFRHFGHDIIVLHENEIRRRKNQFKFLYNKALETNFIVELSQIIDSSDFKVITCVIDKNKLNTSSIKDKNPYHIALEFCLNSLNKFLLEQNQQNKKTHIIVEARGKREDSELELEFRRLCDCKDYKFDIVIADKKTNSIGLQLADMIARPIGKHVINSKENNRAYEMIKRKIYQKNDLGFKIYP